MISAQKLCKTISGRIVLDSVSLQLEDNALMVLSGPSGSGKTTLLRILAGLDVPDSGTVSIDGEIVTDKHHCLAPHRRNIGFAFQSPALWPHMTVTENIRFAIAHGSRQACNERVRSLLEEVGTADLANRYPSEISYGQARRVALARALASQPRYLFLDEPLTNLDPQSRSRLLGLVKDENASQGTTVLFVTHDLDEIEQLNGEHLLLMDGKLTCAAV